MSIRGHKDYWKSGSWNAICDRCGFKFKGEELQKEWTGSMVCGTCFEPRHPQDFQQAVPDNKPKQYYRPDNDSTEVFLPDTPADPSTLIP